MSAGSGGARYGGDASPLPPHLDPRGKHRGRGSTVRPWRPLGRVLGAVLSVGLLVLAGYAWLTYRDINNGVPRLHNKIGVQAQGGHDIDGTAQNILLVGNDDRTNMTDAEVHQLHVGRDGGSKATDTMIILHIPADGSRATLISLPRDSYVHIPGNGMNRLNSAYVDGYNSSTGTVDDKRTAGANLLITTVQNLTGLTINHYIQVSLLGFYEISNAIGGVPINLCHNVNDTVAYDRQTGQGGGSGFKMSKGHHVIKGVTALEFVRQRHNLPLGDIDRVRRQQYFLTAAFRRVASIGIFLKLHALGNAVKRTLILDPGLSLTGLARQMENLSANNIVGRTIPFARFDNNTPVGSVEIINPAKVKKFVEKVINPPPATPSTPASSSTSPAPGSSRSPGKNPIDSHCID